MITVYTTAIDVLLGLPPLFICKKRLRSGSEFTDAIAVGNGQNHYCMGMQANIGT
jgi:hypothetical protein